MKHYQVGDWLRSKKHRFTGEVVAIHRLGDSYRYTIQEGEFSYSVPHSESQWLGDEKPKLHTITIPIRFDLTEARKQIEQLKGELKPLYTIRDLLADCPHLLAAKPTQ